MQHTISVFGLGYVGCVTAACLAQAGHEVIGVDINPEKVRMINEGKSPIVEAGLEQVINEMVVDGYLHATTSCQKAIEGSEMAFICVGTPGDRNGQLKLDALVRVAHEIGEALRAAEKPFTVVVRSTTLPGTVESVVLPALLESGGKRVRPLLRLASNPEFLREGSALKDFAKPPLTLVGSDDKATAALLKSVYVRVDAPFVHTQIGNAEAAKYVSNAYHALKICFANEVGRACSTFGLDAHEVMRIFCMDNQLNISTAYLRPGFAFGGSCLPKDLKALLYALHHANVDAPVLAAILPSNQAQLERGIEAVLATGKKKIGVFGLAFKSGTDDLRESPLVTVVETLIGKGCDVRVFDRNVSIAKLVGANREYIVEEIPHISNLMLEDLDALVAHSEVLVIGSDDREAAHIHKMARPDQVIVDLTRGMLNLRSDPRQSARVA